MPICFQRLALGGRVSSHLCPICSSAPGCSACAFHWLFVNTSSTLGVGIGGAAISFSFASVEPHAPARVARGTTGTRRFVCVCRRSPPAHPASVLRMRDSRGPLRCRQCPRPLPARKYAGRVPVRCYPLCGRKSTDFLP